ncbi:mitochondrial ribosomal protein L44 isoform X2 [Nomia melanderi]|uniref:mitochondrial ribosomal protein L44 isoform X2 n=1 Tax=Nomia melanderi TaxID=2448451 RepID=UPI0013042A72|nr:39S ribosomal protein L44, mitochondrial isoform X2 [Nomia melanderi]
MKEITRRKRKLPPQPEPIRSTFTDWNRDAELYAFNQRLFENFITEKLNQALTHKSYVFAEEQKQREMNIKDPKLEIQHNEDLIQIGREITSVVVRNYLKKSLPCVPESGITAFHDYLMSQEILAIASSHIGTKDLILSEEHPVKEETLAKTFLALVAALAESTDTDHASAFVRDFLIVGLACKDLTEIWCPSEPFEMLNDIVSKENNAHIEPRIIRQAGKNTILSAYQIAVYCNKQFLGSGFGQTVKEAKNVAALNALYRKFGLLDSSQPLRFDQAINV